MKKTWIFLNKGNVEWPEDATFSYICGPIINPKEVKVDRLVKPGDKYAVVIDFEAPKNVGRITTFYRFQFGS